jgi:hypothetical protein
MNELAQSSMKQVDDLIQTALDEDNIDIVLIEINKMRQVKELVGKALAKTLYLLHQNWYQFSVSESESFLDTLATVNISDPQRYLNVGKYIELLPPSIQDKPIREIIPITNSLAQGYSISDENMEKLERTTNLSEVQKIVTEDIKGQEPRKSRLQGYLNSSDGTLYCWYNGERHNSGYLDVHNQTHRYI